MAEETGLLASLAASGFSQIIDYKDLNFDSRRDFIGGGGYGDVYKAHYLQTPVAIKRFGRRY